MPSISPLPAELPPEEGGGDTGVGLLGTGLVLDGSGSGSPLGKRSLSDGIGSFQMKRTTKSVRACWPGWVLEMESPPGPVPGGPPAPEPPGKPLGRLFTV